MIGDEVRGEPDVQQRTFPPVWSHHRILLAVSLAPLQVPVSVCACARVHSPELPRRC